MRPETRYLKPKHQIAFWRRGIFGVFLVSCLLSPVSVSGAQQLPSLFRGVVVADGSLGVRVVSVQDGSQAFLADLRPDDVIIRINETDVRSIDEFATLSSRLKGQAISVKVVVFRNGVPQELLLHVYSYPVLREWGIEFIPDHDVRFAEPQVGLEYWRRLGRGFQEARKPAEAVNAYLNGLHNVPTDTATAFAASTLFLDVSRAQFDARRMKEGITTLRQSLLMLEKLFESPLSDAQLQTVRDQLQATLHTLRQATIVSPTPVAR